MNEDRLIFLAAQKDITEDEPKVEDLYQFGTVCMVMRMLKLSDGRVKILVQGLSRGKIKSIVKENPSYIVKIEKVHDPAVKELTLEMEVVMRNVRDQMEKLSTLGKTIPTEVTMVIENIQDPGKTCRLGSCQPPSNC